MTKSSHTSYSDEQLKWLRDELIDASVPAKLNVNALSKLKIHKFNEKFDAKRTYPALSAKAYELVRHENLSIHLSPREVTLRKKPKQANKLPATITPTKEADNDFKLELENQPTHHKNIVSAIELLIDEL